MRKFGGWEKWLFSDSWGDWRQYDALNEAADEIAAATAASASSSAALEKLFQLDRAQGEEIARLRITVQILISMLSASGGLDARELGFKAEAALADFEAEQAAATPQPGPPTAFETLGKVPPAESPPSPVSAAPPTVVRCDGCGDRVPADQTTITENRGTLCDRCLAGAG
jgi:hypothetical protein